MVQFLIEGKRFGKPYITYKAVKTDTKEVLLEGRCKEYSTISKVFFELRKDYPEARILEH